MTDIEQAIKDAIESKLPTQVGTVLKERLEQAEKDAKAVDEVLRTANARADEIRRLQSDLADAEKIVAKSGDLDKRERDLELREKVIELREECAAVRVVDMRSLVEAVFANNRFKYSMTGQIPVADSNGCVYSQPTDRHVEGEG